MKLYFAGSDAAPRYNAILSAAGVRHRLESYYSLQNRAPSSGFDLLLDSGGFVARTKGVPIDVRAYADYLNRHGVRRAFNLDTADVAETLANQSFLEAHTPTTIIPVYHYSDYASTEHRDLLTRYLERPYLALGGVAGVNVSRDSGDRFFQYVFSRTRNTVGVHGLGITTRRLLLRFPFYSVDSTTWLGSARYGSSSFFKGDARALRSRALGYLERTRGEVQRWVEVEKNVTAVWAHRGVSWPDTLG